MDRWFWRSRLGRQISRLERVPGRFLLWWSLYRLRLSWARFFVECGSILLLLGLASLSFLFISHCIFQSVQVQGPSMYPTLFNTDIYWLDRLAYQFHDPRPGDIVALKDPSGHGFDVKRIIAIPNQSVFIDKGNVYINGRVLWEPYIPIKVHTYAYERKPDELWCLGPNQFFVMGDNRNNSCDSRTFGPIKREAILGRVLH